VTGGMAATGSRKEAAQQTRDDDKAEQQPQLAALCEKTVASDKRGPARRARPILPGTSLMGVLKARAAWLEALDNKRHGHGPGGRASRPWRVPVRHAEAACAARAR